MRERHPLALSPTRRAQWTTSSHRASHLHIIPRSSFYRSSSSLKPVCNPRSQPRRRYRCAGCVPGPGPPRFKANTTNNTREAEAEVEAVARAVDGVPGAEGERIARDAQRVERGRERAVEQCAPRHEVQ